MSVEDMRDRHNRPMGQYTKMVNDLHVRMGSLEKRLDRVLKHLEYLESTYFVKKGLMDSSGDVTIKISRGD